MKRVLRLQDTKCATGYGPCPFMTWDDICERRYCLLYSEKLRGPKEPDRLKRCMDEDRMIVVEAIEEM